MKQLMEGAIMSDRQLRFFSGMLYFFLAVTVCFAFFCFGAWCLHKGYVTPEGLGFK